MVMIDGDRSDRVSGVRRFRMGEDELEEQLTRLSDVTHAFAYRITKSPMPWRNYRAELELRAVTAEDATLAVWTADWEAEAQADSTLVPMVAEGVFGRAFATLAEQLGAARFGSDEG